MRPIHHAIDLDTTPSTVFALLTRLDVWPRFFPYATAARASPATTAFGPNFVAGGAFQLTLTVPVRGAVEVPLAVVEAIAPTRLLVVGRAFGLRAEHLYTLEDRGRWTRLTAHETFSGPLARLVTEGVWRHLDRLAHDALGRFQAIVVAEGV